ncbi:MAG: Na+/H+ antiporter subunit E [Campylobacterota bacterium]|nr:Na+/H+ antiporter subunit E [Campylobacterota bacterium]
MIGKFILLFIVWIGLTNSLDIQELVVGAIVSFVVVYFFADERKLPLLKSIKKYILFIPIFFKSLIKSNIEVAKIVLSPKIDINPSIVKLNTSLTNDFDKLLLCNSITLTPGTITMELDDQNLYVHILDLKTKDKDILQKEIIDSFEKAI